MAELPADPEPGNETRQVLGAMFSRVRPTPTAAPRLLAYSREVAQLVQIGPDELQSERWARVLSGNALLPGMEPHAACYGGHQFGSWAGQLGDGRAISLGETPGRDGQLWELQLKGAGPTPYSRRADGRAVLRSSVREFLCSEAMHHLGVPTTRALSLVATGDQVLRDMFYDGRAADEPGAIVCRVAPTFLRFGNFELFALRQDTKNLRQLAAFALRHFFAELVPPGTDLKHAESVATADAVLAMFEKIARSTAEMVAHWMRVGFVHGVMNTDNMSILGLTLDYGPYGWLEDFDPGWTPNTTDAQGRRYRFGNQPRVAEWNLVQLANALLPLVDDTGALTGVMHRYGQYVASLQEEMMASKLGLPSLARGQASAGEQAAESTDRLLVSELFDALQLTPTDMTIFFRQLADLPIRSDALNDADIDHLRAPLEDAYYEPKSRTPDVLLQLDAWLRRYVARSLAERERGQKPEERRRLMQATNPRYVLRNYLAQQAIERAAAGDTSEIELLLDVLRRPYEEQPGLARYAEKRPEWARHKAGCSMLSCSS